MRLVVHNLTEFSLLFYTSRRYDMVQQYSHYLYTRAIRTVGIFRVCLLLWWGEEVPSYVSCFLAWHGQLPELRAIHCCTESHSERPFSKRNKQFRVAFQQQLVAHLPRCRLSMLTTRRPCTEDRRACTTSLAHPQPMHRAFIMIASPEC